MEEEEEEVGDVFFFHINIDHKTVFFRRLNRKEGEK